MKTLTDVKRRIEVGTRLMCVAHDRRPEMVGSVRRVVQAMGVAFVSNIEGQKPERFYTRYPKASKVQIVDADTFKMAIVGMFDNDDSTEYVTLRFEPSVSL